MAKHVIILSSEEIKAFLVFETTKTREELLSELRAASYTPEQHMRKSLVFALDLKSHLYSDTARAEEAKTKLKKQWYIQASGGEGAQQAHLPKPPKRPEPKRVELQKVSQGVSGMSFVTSLFFNINIVLFVLIILGSVIIGFAVNIFGGIAAAVGSVMVYGTVSVMRDLLINVIEINEKLSGK